MAMPTGRCNKRIKRGLEVELVRPDSVPVDIMFLYEYPDFLRAKTSVVLPKDVDAIGSDTYSRDRNVVGVSEWFSPDSPSVEVIPH